MDGHDHAGITLVAEAVVIDLAANAIRLQVPGFPEPAGEGATDATLDIGSNGRLIGLEIGPHYVSVMDIPGMQDPYVRSAGVRVEIKRGSTTEIAIPRRDASYEITYPSGNECWQMKSVGGQLIQVCATIDDAPSALRDALARRRAHPHRH